MKPVRIGGKGSVRAPIQIAVQRLVLRIGKTARVRASSLNAESLTVCLVEIHDVTNRIQLQNRSGGAAIGSIRIADSKQAHVPVSENIVLDRVRRAVLRWTVGHVEGER